MNNKNYIVLFSSVAIFSILYFLFYLSYVFASTTIGIIDSVNKYAFTSNAGWINFGCASCNVQITDSAITGYAWSDNYGFIILNPSQGGVLNDGEGNLSGFAWSENAGWINFNNVVIDASGKFTGTASSDNIGTIVFDNCGNFCAVKTDWRPISQRGNGS